VEEEKFGYEEWSDRPQQPGGPRLRTTSIVIIVVVILVLAMFAATTYLPLSPTKSEFENEYKLSWAGTSLGFYSYMDRIIWLSWTHDEDYVVTNFGHKKVAFWSDAPLSGSYGWKTFDLPVQDIDEGNAFWDVEASPVDDVVAVGWYQGIAFFDANGTVLAETRGGQANSVAWNPGGGLIAASWIDHNTSSISLEVIGYPNLESFKSRDLDVYLNVLEWSPNALYLAGCSRTGGLYLFDSNMVQLFHLPNFVCYYSLSWSPDSSAILVTSEDGLILLDVKSLEEKTVITAPSEGEYCGSNKHFSGRGPVYSGSFSPDGDMIAAAYFNGVVEIWSGDGEESIDKLLFRPCVKSPPKEVYSVKWSPTGGKIAAVGEHGITVWRSK
jgi:hypothetical protein